MSFFSKLSASIREKSTSNLLIAIFGIIYLTSQIIIGLILHQIGTLQALRLQTTLSSDTFKAIASQWMASGEIEAYYRHFQFDNFHPIWYGIFLSLLIARAFEENHMNSRYNFIILSPFVAAACDLFENFMHLYFLADLHRATPVLVALSGTATNLKWLLAFVGMMIVMVLFVLKFMRTFVGR
jgi:hypothetical protein